MVHCARDSTHCHNPCIVEYIILCSLRMCVCRQCSLGVHPMKCQICSNLALYRRDVSVYAEQHPDRANGQIALGCVQAVHHPHMPSATGNISPTRQVSIQRLEYTFTVAFTLRDSRAHPLLSCKPSSGELGCCRFARDTGSW
jgi:hypothetical protein